MTPFEQAVLSKAKTPDVYVDGGKVDYFQYQLAVHKMYLSLMAKGIQNSQVKLKELKNYYGLKGRTAAQCLEQFITLINNYNKN